MSALRSWSAIITGEPASKANSRQIVKIAGKLRSIKSKKALRYVASVARQVAPLPPDQQLRPPISITAHVYYASQRPDLDISLILDLLQGRVFKNDRAVRQMHLYHHIDRNNPRADITLVEIEGDAHARNAAPE